MSTDEEFQSVLRAWTAEHRVILCLIGDHTDSGLKRPSWADDETGNAARLIELAGIAPTVSRETTGTKKLASLPPASRKRVMEAKASYEKRVAELEVPTRRKRRKAA